MNERGVALGLSRFFSIIFYIWDNSPYQTKSSQHKFDAAALKFFTDSKFVSFKNKFFLLYKKTACCKNYHIIYKI